MIKENKYCSDVVKNHFNKEAMKFAKEAMKFLKTLLNFNINVKSSHKIPAAFHNVKNYDSPLIM